MDADDVLALLDLLESRGVVAWVAPPDEPHAVAFLAEADGADSVVRLLVARGFTVVDAALPARLRLRHPEAGDVEVHPASFRPDGCAVRFLPDGGTITVDSTALVVAPYGSGRARQVRRET